MINARGMSVEEPERRCFLGSLRDLCLQDKRPTRHLYGIGRMPCESKLAKTFFVHSETGDVLSLLPYVSLPRIYRSSNVSRDEEGFRSMCAQLALCILWAHVDSEKVMLNKIRAMTDLWETHGSRPETMAMRESWSDLAYIFCRTGMVDDRLWRKLRSNDLGSRDTRKVK